MAIGDGYATRVPAHTVLDPNWSGWITQIPPGNRVTRITATFTIPVGMLPSDSGYSQVALGVGIGDYHPLQSGIAIHVNLQTGQGKDAVLPLNDWLEDCTSLATCVAQFDSRLYNGGPGAHVHVRLQFPPVFFSPRLAGFWMVSHITVTRGGVVLDSESGRLYVPPWSDPHIFEAVVEDTGNPERGRVTYLPNGKWAVPVRWSAQLARPWPSARWAETHAEQVTAKGWYPRAGITTHLHNTHIRITRAGETGSGTVTYDDRGYES